MYKVYKITNNITNKLYFGYTSTTVIARWKKHCLSKRNFYISNNINKYGPANFTIEQLYEFETPVEAKTTEIYLIAKYQTNMRRYPSGTGMNMTDGGEGSHGFRHSLESIEKMKKIQQNRSQQWKDRISTSHKGNILSEEHKRKIGNSGKGKKWSDTAKKRIAGNNNHFYGKHHSEDTKEKLRLLKTHKMKSIKQFDLDGNLLYLHPSVQEAGKFVNTDPRNIISVCKGRSKTSVGFKWEYE